MLWTAMLRIEIDFAVNDIGWTKKSSITDQIDIGKIYFSYHSTLRPESHDWSPRDSHFRLLKN